MQYTEYYAQFFTSTILERNPLSIDLYSHDVFMQKLEYIHCNPVKAGLCSYPEAYKYSSARFYMRGVDEFGFLTRLNV